MEHAEFHISVVMAVIFNEIGLSQEGLPAFCDLLEFMTGDSSPDNWNSEDVRRLCRESLLEQEPGLGSIEKYLVQTPGKDLWWRWLEDRFGSRVLVGKIQNGVDDLSNS